MFKKCYTISMIGGTLMNLQFKIMEQEDLQETIELCNLCFEENTDMEYAEKMYSQTVNDLNQIYIIGKLNDKIVAHLKITVIPTIYEDMNTYAIFNHVCVHPDFRRHKLGTKLLDFAFQICREKKCKTIELWSRNFRIAAHKLYIDYGFNIDDAKFFSKTI